MRVGGVNQRRREGEAIQGCVLELAAPMGVCLLVLEAHKKSGNTAQNGLQRQAKKKSLFTGSSLLLVKVRPMVAAGWGGAVSSPTFLGGTHLTAKWVPVGIREHPSEARRQEQKVKSRSEGRHHGFCGICGRLLAHSSHGDQR